MLCDWTRLKPKEGVTSKYSYDPVRDSRVYSEFPFPLDYEANRDHAKIWDPMLRTYTFTVGEYKNSLNEDGSILNPLFNKPYHIFRHAYSSAENVDDQILIVQFSPWYLEKYQNANLRETPDNFFDKFAGQRELKDGRWVSVFENGILPPAWCEKLRSIWAPTQETVTDSDLFMTLAEGVILTCVSKTKTKLFLLKCLVFFFLFLNRFF